MMFGTFQFFVTNGLLAAATVLFALGFWIAYEHRQSARDTTFAGMLVAVAFWVFVSALAHATVGTGQEQFWYRSTVFFGSLVPTAFLLLALSYGRNRLPSLPTHTFVIAPTIITFTLAYFAPLTASQGGALTLGIAHGWLAAHFAVVTVVALVLILHASMTRKQIAHTVLAAVLGGALLAFSAIFLALYARGSASLLVPQWMLSLSLFAGLATIAWAIVRKKLHVDLRRTGIELALLLLLVVFMAGIVISATTPLEFMFRLTLLLLLVIYGAMALRTFVREMQRHREIEGLYDRLTKLNTVLMRADRLKTRFVSFASHQLRAPLGGIRGYLDMLHRGDFGTLTEPQQRIIGLNLDAVNRLTQTIEMFLDITRIELGKLDLYITPTDISGLIVKAVAEMQPLADKKGLTLATDVSASLPPVPCDATKLFHVFANLIDNAIKYTQKGGVTVRAREEGGHLVVEVVDTGIGMDTTDRARLFHLFERGISAVKLESSGEGLGLYIVKNIVTAHKGSVFIESAGKGKGSLFGFRIPL